MSEVANGYGDALKKKNQNSNPFSSAGEAIANSASTEKGKKVSDSLKKAFGG